MPKQKRATLKRKCEYMMKDIDHALNMAGQLMDVYYPNYPDYYIFIQTWIDALNAVKKSAKNFREMI